MSKMVRIPTIKVKERDVQIQVKSWLVKNYGEHLSKMIIHIPNEGKRSPAYGKMLKNMGMRAGVSDLFIAIPRGGYHGAWIEIKVNKNKLTSSQKEFLDDMSSQNYYTKMTRGYQQTIDAIKEYLDIC